MGALLSVALGSALGGTARYLLTLLGTRATSPFIATMLINISGCFLAGMLINFLPSARVHSIWNREFLIAGMLGGYTTFSAFSLQTLDLFHEGKTSAAIINVLASVIFSLLAVWVGHKLGLFFVNR